MTALILLKEDTVDQDLSALENQYTASGLTVSKVSLFDGQPDYAGLLLQIEAAEHVICWK